MKTNFQNLVGLDHGAIAMTLGAVRQAELAEELSKLNPEIVGAGSRTHATRASSAPLTGLSCISSGASAHSPTFDTSNCIADTSAACDWVVTAGTRLCVMEDKIVVATQHASTWAGGPYCGA